jgi:hypothetical protein
MLTIRAAVAWLICSAAMANAETPTIVRAIVNSTTSQITITGASLSATGALVVKLDSATLTLVSSSSNQIVANLPAGLMAGNYRMTVNNGSGTPGVFDVSNGVVGPQGPSGSRTLPFIGSASSSSGPVFQITNTSAAHSAISGHGGGGSAGEDGGTGTSGYVGASAGTSSETAIGGDGVYALGSTGTGENDIGGPGISAYGGPGGGAVGGNVVLATGANGNAFGGDGIDAYGGNGANGGYGIYAQAGSGFAAYAGYFYGDVEITGTLSKGGAPSKSIIRSIPATNTSTTPSSNRRT